MYKSSLFILIVTVFALSVNCLNRLLFPPDFWLEYLYIGSYASANSQGIYQYQLDANSGAFTPISSIKGGLNPSYLTLDKEKRTIYAVNEDKDGHLSSFSVSPVNGKLTFLSQQKVSGGPCHVSTAHLKKAVLVTSCDAGNVTSFSIQQGGYLSPASDVHYLGTGSRSKEGHRASFAVMDPFNRYAYVIDSASDEVRKYFLDEPKAKIRDYGMVAFKTKQGAGPRHLIFGYSGWFAYLIQEFSNTITVLRYDIRGTFTEVQTISTLPESFKSQSQAAAVKISTNGKFLYASNRGANNIVVYSIDRETEKLSVVQFVPSQGDWPRDIAIDSFYKLLVVTNERSNNVVSFKIDQRTGKLTPTGHQISIPRPASAIFMPK